MSKENQRLNGVDQKPTFLDRLSIRARTVKDAFLNLKGFKEVDSKDIKIDGVDPKSYGAFDRFMDGATRFFRKYGLEVAALLTLTSCTTGGAIGVSVMTSEPAKTSTLPGDLTKTAESPTDAPIELTPSSGIETTINLPTEEATEMLTASPTSEATATATEVLEVGEISTERKQEIVDRVNAFINAEGQYSDEELRKDPTWFGLDTDESEPLPLGMINSGSLQTILVDYQLIDNNCHYFLGTHLRNGERAVFDFSQPIDVDYYKFEVRKSGFPDFGSTAPESIEYNNFEEKSYFLNKLLGKPFTLFFMINMEVGENEPEFFKLMASSVCKEYYTDLYNLVFIVEDKFGLSHDPNDSEQSVMYYIGKDLLTIEKFNTIMENDVACSSLIVIRNP